MPKPMPDEPRCDVQGCGSFATYATQGDEVDVQGLGRPALPRINVCDRHMNWPHSEDAKRFALTPLYGNRK
jgi:hypothetical protein